MAASAALGLSRPSRIRNSAIWTALSAAPFQRLSPLTQNARPLWRAVSRRIRPTPHFSVRLKSSGIGYACWEGSSTSCAPAKAATASRASSTLKGRSNDRNPDAGRRHEQLREPHDLAALEHHLVFFARVAVRPKEIDLRDDVERYLVG